MVFSTLRATALMAAACLAGALPVFAQQRPAQQRPVQRSIQPSPAAQRPAQPAAPAVQCDAAKFRVIVDVGHTPESPGAISARGVNEYDFNLKLAKAIERKL